MTRKLFLFLVIMSTLALTGCRYIDDDTSDCKNCDETLTLNFRLHVVGDVREQVDSQLTSDEAKPLRQPLFDCLSPLMAPKENHATLMFFDVSGKVTPTVYPVTFTSYNVIEHTTLPPAHYHLLAVTGTDDRALLADSGDVKKADVSQPHGDTIPPHRTVILAGRKDIAKNAKGTIVIPLYPVNDVVAVVTKEAAEVKDVDILLTGFSDRYLVSDSTYHFNRSQYIKAEEQNIGLKDYHVYTAITMPSRGPETRAILPARWHALVFAHLTDGTTTRTILTIREPLDASDVKVLNLTIGSNGAAESSNLNVGASVTLDWKKGGGYNPEI